MLAGTRNSLRQEIRSVGLAQCNVFIFDHVTFIQLKICSCVQNFTKIGWFFTEIWRYIDFRNGGRSPSWKKSKIWLFVLTWSTNVTDTQTDTHADTAWRHRACLCIASRGKNNTWTCCMIQLHTKHALNVLSTTCLPNVLRNVAQTSCRPNDWWPERVSGTENGAERGCLLERNGAVIGPEFSGVWPERRPGVH